MTDATTQSPQLLSDDQMLTFVARGYHVVEPALPDAFHASLCEQLADIDNPGNGILDAVPRLAEVYAHPAVHGALISLLGPDYQMNGHRHLHTNLPGSQSQGWHQDGTNVRHHQVWCVLAMYYPQDVPVEMGPTVVMPGTHLRNAPTDRLQTYANLRGQVPLVVKAGTVAITHYDIWHAATLNRTDAPRHMLKFLFDRTAPPAAPSWDHDPAISHDAVQHRITEQVSAQGYCSDYYKEWELRKEMWQWLLGEQEPPGPGAFKDMLSDGLATKQT